MIFLCPIVFNDQFIKRKWNTYLQNQKTQRCGLQDKIVYRKWLMFIKKPRIWSKIVSITDSLFFEKIVA